MLTRITDDLNYIYVNKHLFWPYILYVLFPVDSDFDLVSSNLLL